ncbi:Tyrosinase [Fusarium oxysporum f. sp. cubense]|uniref:tyrosinase n=1 Tax=Fusarium oxysporum f. sp. cubense TaxID=61366 RepID=A0A559KSM7_FUSOC|nr:Tyrosinase [Fusarium oxysporum f. sp. cubense]
MRIILAWLLFAAVTAQSYNYGGVDIDSLTRRQDPDAPIVVKALPQTRNGTTPLRLEIRQMKADRYKWDLFILSMSMFQDVSQEDPASWYKIAGIHGVPFEAWNGVEAAPGANQSGYCAHSSVLFPVWHRPYLALFEQELYRMANVIAGMFPNGTDRQPYIDAARDFRMPYWDWAMPPPEGESHFPDVFWNATISQWGPRGVQEIRNPLYSYRFHPKNATAMIWSPLRDWDETKRAPNASESETDPTSDNEKVNAALLSRLPEIQRRLYELLTSYKDFNSFGTKAWGATQNLSTADSIESVHDIIHTDGGLGGHMTYVPLSSFDPLFLLHHAMTDRVVAIWQALNPYSWVTPMPAGENSFTTLKGEMQDSQSPLTPFFASVDGTFWNSDTARTTEAFGYTYADTDLTGKQKEDVRQDLQKKLSEWWGGSAAVGLQASTDIMMAGGISSTDYTTKWTIAVLVNMGAFPGSYAIHFYLGQPPAVCGEQTSHYVGGIPFAGILMTNPSDSVIAAALPIESRLRERVIYGGLPSLSFKDVEYYLLERQKLQLCVMADFIRDVDPAQVSGLRVEIVRSSHKDGRGSFKIDTS